MCVCTHIDICVSVHTHTHSKCALHWELGIWTISQLALGVVNYDVTCLKVLCVYVYADNCMPNKAVKLMNSTICACVCPVLRFKLKLVGFMHMHLIVMVKVRI